MPLHRYTIGSPYLEESMELPSQDQAVNLKHKEEGTRNLIQMSGTAPIMIQHHIPEQLKLQQHQYGKSLMSKLLLGKLRTSHTKKHSHYLFEASFALYQENSLSES